jgi:homoserine dehydrogenase
MIRVGIVGFGTVGQGTARAVVEHREEIAARAGFEVGIGAVCDLKIHELGASWLPPGVLCTTDWRELITSPRVDIVAELIGGTSVACDVLTSALAAGKPVVTANKNLIAEKGAELEALAREKGVSLEFEAAVAGGIPVLAAIREGLAGERVLAVHGILNGTCNFVLSTMEKTGRDMDGVLREAQALGYAEADPRADIEGHDARYKLAILARLAFGAPVRLDDIACRGISEIRAVDFLYARQIGCTVRLIAAARRMKDGAVELSVGPVLIPLEHILAKVDGAYNAVWVEGRRGGDTLYYGRGAGGDATGIAVVADLIRVARDLRCGARLRLPPLGFNAPVQPYRSANGSRLARRYLRFIVRDRPGIIAELAAVLARHSVNIDAVIQASGCDKQRLPFVITLEAASEAVVRAALEEMKGFSFLREPPLEMAIEEFAAPAGRASAASVPGD